MEIVEILRERLSTEVTPIPEEMPFAVLVETVTRSGESHFPVVDRAGRMTEIVAMVSKRDIVDYYYGRSIS